MGSATVLHPHAASAFAILVTAALMLSGCTASPPGGTGGPSTPASTVLFRDGKADTEAVNSRLGQLKQMGSLEQQLEAATLDVRVARVVRNITGIDKEMGGAEAADAIFAAHGAALVDKVRTAAASEAAAIAGRAPNKARHAGDAPSIGEGMFGGLMAAVLIPEGVVSATNSKTEAGTQNVPSGTLTADAGYVGVTQDFVYTDKGTTSTLKTDFELKPCPDAGGKFSAHGKIAVSVSTSSGAQASGVLDVNTFGEVGDDAQVVSSDLDFTMSESSASGSIAKVSGAVGDTVATRLEFTPGSEAGAALGQNLTSAGLVFAYLVKYSLVEAARKGWESGRCVDLQVSASPGPKKLSPSSTSTIAAAPRSKIDGEPTGGTVTATLSAGAKSVEPGGKVKADATFTFTAPDKRKQSGTIDFESRSRRGVGKASLTLDTNSGGWVASGGSSAIVFSGKVADLAKPFTLKAVLQGVRATFAYTPTSETAGKVTYSGTGAGFTMSGKGTYAISGDPSGPLTLKQTHSGCVNIGACRTNTDVITLTPVS